MKITATPYALQFRHPFKLASGVRSHTDTVIIRLEHNGFTGYGEASLPPYLPENVQSVMAFAEKVNPDAIIPADDLGDALQQLEWVAIGNNAAKAAFDIALHDLHCKMRGISLSDYFEIGPDKVVHSSYTIGISSEAEMIEKLKLGADFNLIKLKLGTPNDKLLVDRFLKHCDKPFFADVNQGWTDPSYALDMAGYLSEKGALFIEQPMPVAMREEMAWLSEVCSIPFVADESVQGFDTIPEVLGVFKGINIKLMKCGGLAEAYRMIDFARFMGLKVVLGCMAESSCAVTAAAHLAPLADYADLDGPLLITNDPFTGAHFEEGRVVVPRVPGHGAALRMEL
jgi:L-alanine-DL-glutamate epimerase-like enolase superfamily enzyme